MVHTFQIDKSWQEWLRIATFGNDSLAVGNYSGKKNPHKNRTVELKESQKLFFAQDFLKRSPDPTLVMNMEHLISVVIRIC